ncbi:hypothetical protein [Pseudotabrizicola algicola]|uniref:Uncharacterized protein n=1 Tax=Pseudotabrizicola algicola TaxID=2709381 RepID=A0A6B3RU28_9RHOB|nr:hypothetical protein [Pseudotabrizicola algicola]NEX47445.1 hypothetical protein [Pseudotabrizicola algicola]
MAWAHIWARIRRILPVKSGRIIADGIVMHHDWVCEVLEDLRSYALDNGLPATAAQVEEVLRVLRAELRGAEGPLGRPPAGRKRN